MKYLVNLVLLTSLQLSCATDSSPNVDDTKNVVSESRLEKPFYRFWLGERRDGVSAEDLATQRSESFIPYAQRNLAPAGLHSYLVALPPKQKATFIPDDFALLVYESKDKYEQTRSSAARQEFSSMHKPLFAKTSRSAVPIDFKAEKPRSIEAGKAYDMLGSPIDWQAGHNTFFIGARKDSISKSQFLKRMHSHVQMADRAFGKEGLRGYLFLATEDYEVAYLNWQDKSAFDRAMASADAAPVVKDAADLMDNVMWGAATKFAGKIESGGFVKVEMPR